MAADPEWLEKMRSVGSVTRLSGSQVREGRDAHGNRYKATTDELGSTVTQRAGDRQDVTVRPRTLEYTLGRKQP